jgi:hypothetical protein
MRFGIFYIVVLVAVAAVAKSVIPETPVKTPVVANVELNAVTQECIGEGENLLCVDK